MKSPIKYFGGKGGMFKEILEHFPNTDDYQIYVEPFGGSASILFQKQPSPVEIYNDLEENVYSLFKVISDKKLFEEFKNKCDLTFYSRQLREEFKRELLDENLSLVDRAYRYFYVNRSSLNGIGGFSLSVSYVRRNMSKSVSDFLSAIDRLGDIHNRLSSVIIENKDAIELIEKYDRHDAFFYLDPPYHHSTRTITRYKEDMGEEAQLKFIDVLLSIKKAKVLLSGYDCELYNKLCDNGWERVDFTVKAQSGNRTSKTKVESLWKNYNCIKKEIFEI